MPIDGLSPKTPQPHSTPLGNSESVRRAEADQAAGGVVRLATESGDRVQLSDTSRALGQVGAVEAIPRGTLEPDRLRTILSRLAAGFYDRADIRGQIASHLQLDLS